MTNGTVHLTAAAALWRREVVRFLRQRNRVVGALATPLVFWLLLGSGLNKTFYLPQALGEQTGPTPGYLHYFFPGALALILMFTAVFSTITVIEDRKSGMLQAILVSPASRLSLVVGILAGGTTLATAQAVLFLMIWLFIGPALPLVGWLTALGVIVLLSAGLTGLGICLAWPMQSTAGFHALMNLILMPMWFLSGAVFPVATAPRWLQVLMLANPLTYGQQLLTESLLPGDADVVHLAPTPLAWAVAMVSVILVAAVAVRIVSRRG